MSRKLENLVLGLSFFMAIAFNSVSSTGLPSVFTGQNPVDCRNGACRFLRTWVSLEDLGQIPGTQVEAYNGYSYVELSANGLWETCAPQLSFTQTADFFQSCENQTMDLQSVCNFNAKNFFTPAGTLDGAFLSTAYNSLTNASTMIKECIAWDGSTGLNTGSFSYNYYNYYGGYSSYNYDYYEGGSSEYAGGNGGSQGSKNGATKKQHKKGKREVADNDDDTSDFKSEEDEYGPSSEGSLLHDGHTVVERSAYGSNENSNSAESTSVSTARHKKKKHNKGKRAVAEDGDSNSNSAEEEDDNSSEEAPAGTTESMFPAPESPAPISEAVLQRILNRHKRQAQSGQEQGSQSEQGQGGYGSLGGGSQGHQRRSVSSSGNQGLHEAASQGQKKHGHATGKPGSNTDNEAKGQKRRKKAGNKGKSGKGQHAAAASKHRRGNRKRKLPPPTKGNRKQHSSHGTSSTKALKQMGLSAMPSQADLMRAYCVEASVQVALETCGQGLIKQHGLPPISGPTPIG